MMSHLLRPTFYAAIPSDEKDVAASHGTRHLRGRGQFYTNPLALLVYALIIAVLSAICGFGIGMSLKDGENIIPSWTQSLSRVEFSWKEHAFHYNRTFAMAPKDDESIEPAWDDLVPQGQGFVRYPANNPNIRAVSAVHQLHCLYSIRRTYYLAISGWNTTAKNTKGPHMRHCFDYLRQSLMCAADSSLEPEPPDMRGVTGWAFPRRCHSYDELKEWATRWRANDRIGFRGGPSNGSVHS